MAYLFYVYHKTLPQDKNNGFIELCYYVVIVLWPLTIFPFSVYGIKILERTLNLSEKTNEEFIEKLQKIYKELVENSVPLDSDLTRIWNENIEDLYEN